MKSIPDKAVTKLHERQQLVRERLRKVYKKAEPFRAEKISNDELLVYYNDLQFEDMDYLIQAHGEEKVGDFLNEMEQLKKRRGL